MQKFTRPLTREIEMGGERLAVTLSEQGIQVRTVGSRKPPWEATWASVICGIIGQEGAQPSAEQMTQAVEKLKKGGHAPAAAAAQPAPATPAPDTAAPMAHTPHAEPSHTPMAAPPAAPEHPPTEKPVEATPQEVS